MKALKPSTPAPQHFRFCPQKENIQISCHRARSILSPKSLLKLDFVRSRLLTAFPSTRLLKDHSMTQQCFRSLLLQDKIEICSDHFEHTTCKDRSPGCPSRAVNGKLESSRICMALPEITGIPITLPPLSRTSWVPT